LEVFSEGEGKGSTFTVTLHFQKIDNPPDEQPTTPRSRKNSGSSPRAVRCDVSRPVLLAEDNPLNQRIVLQILHKIGFPLVETAQNGVEVLELLERHGTDHYSILLLDIEMPVLGSFG
jgi:hypothetical protein